MDNVFYRFRSAEKLLDEKYDELKRQSIYFAPPEDLNDPMEGFRHLYWSGDKIVWKNLFRHYLYCLAMSIPQLHLSEDDEGEDLSKTINVRGGEIDIQDLPLASVFEEIKALFFSDEINQLVSLLAKRSTNVYGDELYFYLRFIHPRALDAVLKIYTQHKLFPGENMLGVPSKLLSFELFGQLFSALEGFIKDNENGSKDVAKLLFAINGSMFDQMDLILVANTDQPPDAKTRFVSVEFSRAYIDRLPDLVYPPWYTACFMSDWKNSSVWGHYGQNHAGVCLMFKANAVNGKCSLHLTGQVGVGTRGAIERPREFHLKKINYEEGYGEIDFFQSMGSLPLVQLYSTWYMDGEAFSGCATLMLDSEEEWRAQYWNAFERDLLIKTKDWGYEKEHRILLTSSMGMFGTPQSRVFNYDFDSLQGIIFGINTSMKHKQQIIDVIGDKCEEAGRTDFKFYQAYYDHENNCMGRNELNLIKFGLSTSEEDSFDLSDRGNRT